MSASERPALTGLVLVWEEPAPYAEPDPSKPSPPVRRYWTPPGAPVQIIATGTDDEVRDVLSRILLAIDSV
jgi:hypothetical protein